MRELAPIFSTAAGAAVGYIISPDGMGAYIGASVGIFGEILVSHLPPVMLATMGKEPK